MLFSKFLLRMLRKHSLGELRRHGDFLMGGHIKIGDYCNFSISPSAGKITIGKGVSLRNYINVLVGNGAELILAENVFFNNYCSLNSLEKIEIGANTLFGEAVKLYDHNHQYGGYPDFRVEHQKFSTAPIKIGNNCWLGSHVIVLKGVTIGDNCVIGAGCVIHKDVPANSIVINKQEQIIKSISKNDTRN